MAFTRRRPVRIGLSARIFHPEPGGMGIRTKTLQVLEQSVAQWVAARDVMVVMIPSVVQDGALMRSNIRLRDYAEYLDGLLLQGGPMSAPAPMARSRFARNGPATRCGMLMNSNCYTSSWRQSAPCLVSVAACS